MMVRGSIEGYFAIGKEKERKEKKRTEIKEDKARQYAEQKKVDRWLR